MYEIAWVLIPVHNINLFTAKLFYYRIDSCSIHTNTCAYRINIRIVCSYRKLGTASRLTGNTHNFYRSIFNLCHFSLKKALYKFRMCSANKDSWAFGCILYLKNIYFYALCRFKFFTFYLLRFIEHRICLSKVDADISANITLNNTCYNIFLLLKELIVNNASLFLADFLQNNILCILCRNTPKFL